MKSVRTLTWGKMDTQVLLIAYKYPAYGNLHPVYSTSVYREPKYH